MRSVLVIWTVVVALILVACFIPLRTEAYQVLVEYQEPGTKFVTVSYVADDYMTTRIIEEYQQTGSCGCSRKLVRTEVKIACVNITNTDNVSGDFMVCFTGLTAGTPFSHNTTFVLNASEQRVVEYEGKVIDCWDYEVFPSFKKVTTGEMVTKQRLEIRYKKVTVLDYLLHYK